MENRRSRQSWALVVRHIHIPTVMSWNRWLQILQLSICESAWSTGLSDVLIVAGNLVIVTWSVDYNNEIWLTLYRERGARGVYKQF